MPSLVPPLWFFSDWPLASASGPGLADERLSSRSTTERLSSAGSLSRRFSIPCPSRTRPPSTAMGAQAAEAPSSSAFRSACAASISSRAKWALISSGVAITLDQDDTGNHNRSY
jgi:hypothetical protein